MGFKSGERIKAKRDLYLKSVKEPVVRKGEEGFFVTSKQEFFPSVALFDKDHFAVQGEEPPYNHEYTIWDEGCIETNIEDDIESLGFLDEKATRNYTDYVKYHPGKECPCIDCENRDTHSHAINHQEQ